MRGINIKGALHYLKQTKGVIMTQRELGVLLGSKNKDAANNFVHRLIVGERCPNNDQVRKICEITGVDANYLYGITPLEINKSNLTKNM